MWYLSRLDRRYLREASGWSLGRGYFWEPPRFAPRLPKNIGTVYIRSYMDVLALFQYLWNQAGMLFGFSGLTRKRFCKRNVRSEIRARVLHDVKCEGVTY